MARGVRISKGSEDDRREFSRLKRWMFQRCQSAHDLILAQRALKKSFPECFPPQIEE